MTECPWAAVVIAVLNIVSIVVSKRNGRKLNQANRGIETLNNGGKPKPPEGAEGICPICYH